ncbi:hypothetical protein AB0N61_12890 [Microbacterium sp. NPDC089320]|uniref:hypothetical protein n=1 Tax=Microbacterium sp. NPDC089320 TaxID=3155182 RepID=UPI00344796B8
MTGLTIDHGGAISVDPDVLRDVARRIDAVASRCDDAHSAIMRAHRIIVDTPGFSAHVDTVGLWSSGEHMARLHSQCQESAESTLLMADAYEYVELRAEAEMLMQTDPTAAQRLMRRADRLAATDERVSEMADDLLAHWRATRFEGLTGNAVTPALYDQVFGTAALVGVLSGFGKVLPGETLRGRADPVSVAPVKTSSPAAAPTGLAGALGRMPVTAGAQVAVEKYSFADGSTRFVAYLEGTQSAGAGGKEPWDMRSNAQLYTGQTSSSYQATLDALRAAGAKPGDEVDVIAHSQSAMVAAHLSMESEFDVQMQITAGSPVEPTLDDDQTIIQLRHSDDMVSGLAGGGSPEGTGSPDSVTLRTEGTPSDTLGDLTLDAHQLDTYIDTAKTADDLSDSRIDAMHEFWRELDTAEVIERTEYHAERVG